MLAQVGRNETLGLLTPSAGSFHGFPPPAPTCLVGAFPSQRQILIRAHPMLTGGAISEEALHTHLLNHPEITVHCEARAALITLVSRQQVPGELCRVIIRCSLFPSS